MMMLLQQRPPCSGIPGGAVALIEHPTNALSEKTIGAAIEVHRHLGPGLLESSYIEDALIVELKAVDKLAPIHSAQLMTYMRLQHVSSGLLINFNVDVLARGIRRILL
jgi:hypothetical protein